MKTPIIIFPTLVQVAAVAALYFAATASPAPSPAPSMPTTEIRQLHQQRDQIESRIAALEGDTRVFLPRGMGDVTPPMVSSASSTAPSPNPQVK
jgi:hypothetical protein